MATPTVWLQVGEVAAVSLDSVLKRARKRQSAQFTDTATVRRPVGEVVFDPETEQSVQPFESRYVGIPCKVKTTTQVGFDTNAAQTSVRVISREIEFPLEFEGADSSFAEDDVVEITASTYNSDIGQEFRISDIDRRTWQACRRVFIEESTAPILWEATP